MAFFNADPQPLMLPGFSRVVAQGRQPFIRMVTPRAVPRNEDLTIVTVTPLPNVEVPFAEVRDVILGLLVEDYGLQVREIQKCPLGRGQAFVRLARVSDRDGLVDSSPHLHHGFSLSFVNHNRGFNARRVNFNRECWLMLIGFPPDYRSNEQIGDTIKSFERLLFWQRDNNLARVIIKARVTELADVPHYIVISEGDNFEGVSLTVQCEIIQQNLLGGMLQDEDIPPGGFEEGDFVFPGLPQNQQFGQQLNWPLWPQPQQLQFEDPNGADAVQPDQPVLGPNGGQVPDQIMEDPVLAVPEDQPELPPAHQHSAPISLSNAQGSSVFSSSEVSGPLLPDLNVPVQDDEGDLQYPDVLLPMAGVEPAQSPPNFLAPEIQPEELMNDEEIAEQVRQLNVQQFLEEQQNLILPASNINLNLNVGFFRVLHESSVDFGPFVLAHSKAQALKPNADLFRLWAKYFSPVGRLEPLVQIPKDWAPFFLKMLLSPESFDWAKSLLLSPSWKALSEFWSAGDHFQFALPTTCPDKDGISCVHRPELSEPSVKLLEEDPQSPPSNQDPLNSRTTPAANLLVDTAFRRSPRIREKNGGFKKPSCTDKGCLACSSSPPAIPPAVLRSIGEKVCSIPAEKLSDKALRSKPKTLKAVGEKKSSTKGAKNKKSKKKIAGIAETEDETEDDATGNEDALE
jgi:hypothetical protein